MKIVDVKAFPVFAPLKGMSRRGMGQPVKKEAVIVLPRWARVVETTGAKLDSCS